jgi:hypothetical protein
MTGPKNATATSVDPSPDDAMEVQLSLAAAVRLHSWAGDGSAAANSAAKGNARAKGLVFIAKNSRGSLFE